MMKFSLCIEPVFPELDFYDRFAAAADLGFEAVEFWDPAGRDLNRIARLSAQHHLSIAVCCASEAWKYNLSGSGENVTANLEKSIHIVNELGCSGVIVLSGDKEPHFVWQENRIIDNLKRIADKVEKAGITICLEALNSKVDHKGYFLDTSGIGFDILQKVGSDRIRLLFDIYHMQIMEGNIIHTITQNIISIGHFHSAGVPGRHEHFSGENDYPNILKAIEAAGYNGYFGLEYWPTYDHKSSIRDVLGYLKSDGL